jgi:hypothetical protein
MVSFQCNSQPLMYNHMVFFQDLRSKTAPEICVCENSIFAYIYKQPRFSKFQKLVVRAQMEGFLNDDQANMTVFIPEDKYLTHLPADFFDTIDPSLARAILSASTIPKRLKKDLLTSSPVSYIQSRNPAMRLYVTNVSNVCTLNNCARVIQFDNVRKNGIVHLVDNLIMPSDDHFMN